MSEAAPTYKALIPPEVREYFLPTHFHRTTMQRVMALLPESDAVVDEWLTVMARENEWCGFIITACAAIAGDRPVDSRHLSDAIRSAPSPDYLAVIAWKIPRRSSPGAQRTARRNYLTSLIDPNWGAISAGASFFKRKITVATRATVPTK